MPGHLDRLAYQRHLELAFQRCPLSSGLSSYQDASGGLEQVPIYRRPRMYIDYNEMVCNDIDVHIAWRLLYPQKWEDRSSRSFQIMKNIGPPKLTFVGSFHVHRLMEASNSDCLPYVTRDFLADSACVGCRGLKFWFSKNELNATFLSQHKWGKYGNLWAKYARLNFNIVNYFTALKNKRSTVRLAYVSILPRHWWCHGTHILVVFVWAEFYVPSARLAVPAI